MKIGWLADIHLGNHKRFGGPVVASLNERCRLAVGVFEAAVRRAVDVQCEALFILGDLFDYQRPEAQLLAAVQNVLAAVGSPLRRVFILVGNHDQTSNALGDHALGPLAPYATIVDKPMVAVVPGVAASSARVEVGLLPFVATPDGPGDFVEHALDFIWKDRTWDAVSHRLLGVHLGVSDERTPPWLRNSSDQISVSELAELSLARGISAVFAGNWHDRRFWKGEPDVFQLGALVPTGWDNPGLKGYGTLGIWEDGEIEYEEIPGPRFLDADPTTAQKVVAEARAAKHTPFLRLKAPADFLAGSSLGELVGCKVAGEIVPDLFESTVAARTAATAARSAETLDEAISLFVKEMPLGEGVDRGAVLARAKAYLDKR